MQCASTLAVQKDNTRRALIFGFLLLDALVWYSVLFHSPSGEEKFYFLDVGQGDSELAVLSGNVKVLTDAGPDGRVISELEKILPSYDRYIDLLVISHPQLDHFGGASDVLDRYRIGAIITNGREGAVKEWKQFVEKAEAHNVPFIVLGAGDSIRHRESEIAILSPSNELVGSGELNDTGLVERFTTPRFTALLTADIGASVEQYLLKRLPESALKSHILKIGHHGSKYSSSDEFLRAVDPRIAVIEVGKNRYGHPTRDTLERLIKNTTARIFRTDQDNTVEVVSNGRALSVFGK